MKLDRKEILAALETISVDGERKNKILRRCTNNSDNNHNDHLHIQGYQPTLKEL